MENQKYCLVQIVIVGTTCEAEANSENDNDKSCPQCDGASHNDKNVTGFCLLQTSDVVVGRW